MVELLHNLIAPKEQIAPLIYLATVLYLNNVHTLKAICVQVAPGDNRGQVNPYYPRGLVQVDQMSMHSRECNIEDCILDEKSIDN